ncbi:hypothetical protein ACWD4L_18845 [Streptomyces sp. NPDC002596]
MIDSVGSSRSFERLVTDQHDQDAYTHVVGSDDREAVALLADLLQDPLVG